MTAPTRTRAKAASAPPKRTTRSGEGAPEKRTQQRRGTATGGRSSSAERAYARRAARAEQARRSTTSGGSQGNGERSRRSSKFRPRLPGSRAGFVLMIMALLAGGVVVTLWLSTQTIAGSYKLEHLHERNSALAEKAAQLQRVVTKRESATWLAEQAKELGMVPGGFPARLVVHPDGSVSVVGEPKKVTAPPPSHEDPATPPEQAPADAQAGDSQPQNQESSETPPEESQTEQADDQDTVSAAAGG